MKTKVISVAKRIPGGWTEYQKNSNSLTCDNCGARLWVAPDGKSLYCNEYSGTHLPKQFTCGGLCGDTFDTRKELAEHYCFKAK